VEFIQEALRTSLAEVQLASLAQSRSGNVKLRDYAQKVAADHGRSIQEMKGLLQTVNVVAPASPSVEAQALHDKLAKLSGPEFDAAYLELMVESHEEAIEQYGAQTHANDNKELGAVASRSLPVLKEHLAGANELLASIAHETRAPR
jgi:putative membrane protein